MRCDLHTHAQRYRIDPTRTITLRRAYLADMLGRFRQLAILIRMTVDENDAFGLKPVPVKRLQTHASAAGPRSFDFPRSDQKVQAFMDWLKRAQRDNILDQTTGTRRGVVGSKSWQDVYLQSAYQKGMSRAASEVRKAGARVERSWVDGAFNRPLHADRAGLIYTRAFSDLEGVTQQMDTAISRTLAQGIVEGVGAKELSKRLVDRVSKVGAVRAAAIARTETIRAHAEATLNGFEEAGVEGVEVEAEFSTSQDNAVCPKCEELEGRVFTIKEARGLIPVHPNCRCAWLPLVSTPDGLVLR